MLRSHRSLVLAATALVTLVVAPAATADPVTPAVPRHGVTLDVPAALRSAPFDVPRRVVIPAGWTMSLWARVSDARLPVWAPDGRMLVSRPDNGDVVALKPNGNGVPTQSTVVSGLTIPHGLAFRGNTLYVAEGNQVDTYRYANGAVTQRHIIISGLPYQGFSHPLKSVAVAENGVVFVSVGSSDNISGEDRNRNPEAASILRYNPTNHSLTVYAHGVRNGTGLALDPQGSPWTAMNNRDEMPFPYHQDWDGDGSDDYGKVMRSFVNDHPLEPLAKLTSGRDLGWPYCDPDPSVTPGDPNSTLRYGNRPFVRDPDTNADGSKLNCAALPKIEQGLPAHSAPLGLTFTTLPGLGQGAVVGSHGSWDRTPPREPSVTFFPWNNGKLSQGQPLVTGFQNADGSRWGRTVMAVKGPDGALYITDDQAGAIYRLTPG